MVPVVVVVGAVSSFVAAGVVLLHFRCYCCWRGKASRGGKRTGAAGQLLGAGHPPPRHHPAGGGQKAGSQIFAQS